MAESKRNILIVSSSFEPQNSPRAFRTTELAKEFARQGHIVTILTPRSEPHHSLLEQTFGFTILDLGRSTWPILHIKGSGAMYWFRRISKRLASWLFEYPNLEWMVKVKHALKHKSGYDALISIAVPYPIHWGVAWVRTKKNPIAKVWIADCGDPYMGQENDTMRPPFYFKYVEKWFCSKANYITVPTSGAVGGYYPEFKEKIRVIPQGFRFEDYGDLNGSIKPSKLTFAYAGMFIPGRRDPTEMLEFLKHTSVDFEFHIFTATLGLVETYSEMDPERIKLHKPIPRMELLHTLRSFDFLINFENVGSAQTPSKLIDYAILQKPILSVRTGALDEDNVRKFLNRDYSTSYVVENPDQYRIEHVTRKFENLISLLHYERLQ
jgi:hypothetical protein